MIAKSSSGHVRHLHLNAVEESGCIPAAFSRYKKAFPKFATKSLGLTDLKWLRPILKWPLSQSALLELQVEFLSTEAHVGRMDNCLSQDSGKKKKGGQPTMSTTLIFRAF